MLLPVRMACLLEDQVPPSGQLTAVVPVFPL